MCIFGERKISKLPYFLVAWKSVNAREAMCQHKKQQCLFQISLFTG